MGGVVALCPADRPRTPCALPPSSAPELSRPPGPALTARLPVTASRRPVGCGARCRRGPAGVQVQAQGSCPCRRGQAALAWSQLIAPSGPLSRAGAPVSVLRPVGGVVLAVVGVLLPVSQGVDVRDDQRRLAAVAVLLVALVLAPWWLRLARELTEDGAQRRRGRRADTAHCTTRSCSRRAIRKQADDPRPSPGSPVAGARAARVVSR